ncbi:MAG TPA: hypothetical protein PLJ27_16315 [Polyangiaceae bacterium]|jgi:long-subunit fatty acid transport protein|nr:MAG: hypothetical protein BWY17_01959 [Deltaproteobacteria bacterium ADurb.Bin207]HNZ21743.1 hypothetical protein [Polyangiaceae bacterium]HOD21590.1 hypothetical protein [Polyangiaceae bacterium]HOE50764.1 hypothetical protein [Polyangiaceae bacterium]HOG99696.1 hypothetical protein [Polyangiaceae bacterium]
MFRGFIGVVLTVLVLGVSFAASASGFDLFGVQAQGIAEVSARTAAARDGSASYYNPGGLALGQGYEVDLSALGVMSQLEVQDRSYAIDEPWGATVTVAAAVPLQGPLANRIRLGLALQGFGNTLMKLKLREASRPFFPYYDNRTQRLVVIPALSVRLAEGVGLGLGINTLAGMQGPIDVREGQSRMMEARVVQEAGTVARWIVGVQVEAMEALHLGMTFRQSFGVPLSITTTADVAGIPLVVDISSAEALFDPMMVVLGAKVEPSADASMELDIAYHGWSRWKGPWLGLDTTVSALSISGKLPEGLFRDTMSVRGAVAWTVERASERITSLHGGLGYETSMLDRGEQQGRTNLVDGAKVMVGAGVTVLFPRVLGQGFRAEIGMQMHQVGLYRQEKIACTRLPCPAGTVFGSDATAPDTDITNPGYPVLTGGGRVFVGTVGMGVDL